MNHESPRTPKRPRVLATDLDGTLIPLPDRAENRRDLATLGRELAEASRTLVFVTGRHLEAIRGLLVEHQLPRPDWVIGDVGTTAYASDGDDWTELTAYAEHLEEIVGELPVPVLRESLATFEDFTLQEEHKQGRFKASFYVDAAGLDEAIARVRDWIEERNAPYSYIGSIDPFTGDGLVDLLPRNVSKAYALAWWREHAGHEPDDIVFAGDSGNDLAAFEAGYRTIVVGNADRTLARSVREHHHDQGWMARLHLPEETASSAVLAGCRWFELLPSVVDDLGPDAPLGATPLSAGRTHFRVWAPKRRTVEVRSEHDGTARHDALHADGNGFFAGTIEGIGPGTRYLYRLDGEVERPDPYSRYQPDGVHGPSRVVDARDFPWLDGDWQGVAKDDLVVYELHIGAFTPAGTFRAAIDRLDDLRELGVTAVEVMPVAQTSGRWNWGYDGVNLFAPRNTYGQPDDFRAFVDACHRRGLGVILDVVYNHVGPEGNYLSDFGPYRSPRHHTPWGDALNFDGRDRDPVRRFVVDNALHWLKEYHLDGLRLDAAHFMLDESDWTILDELRQAVTEFETSVDRPIHLIAETNVFDEELLAPKGDRDGYDLLWCDDFAHAVYSLVAPDTRLTSRTYRAAEDLAAVLEHGYVYHSAAMERVGLGDWERCESRFDGDHASSLLVGLQTHDLVGNEPHGRRLHQLTSPDVQKAAAALVLLAPSIPLIFMGEETAAESPFLFFNDFEDDRLRKAVERGRRAEYPDEAHATAVGPTDPRAFEHSQLGRPSDASMRSWYRSLLALRHAWRAAGLLRPQHLRVECEVERCLFTLRYESEGEQSAFVVVRLPAAGGEAETVTIRVGGTVLLDSADPTEDGASLDLDGPRAIVGRGTFDVV